MNYSKKFALTKQANDSIPSQIFKKKYFVIYSTIGSEYIL